MGVNLTIPVLHPEPPPVDAAGQVEMWEQAKREQPELGRLLLALIEHRPHRASARHARACEMCGGLAVNRVPACDTAYLCDWCLTVVNAITKTAGSAR